jgi:hypothetical protein
MYNSLCRCCRSDALAAIDVALARGIDSGTISRRYHVSTDSVRRHKRHIPATVWESLKKSVLTGDNRINLAKLRESESEHILSRLVTQRLSIQKLIADAESKGDLRVAIQANRVLLENLAAEARLLSDLGVLSAEKTTLTSSAAYLALRARLIGVLRDFPEARKAVLRAFGIAEQEESSALGVTGEPESLPLPTATDGSASVPAAPTFIKDEPAGNASATSTDAPAALVPRSDPTTESIRA